MSVSRSRRTRTHHSNTAYLETCTEKKKCSAGEKGDRAIGFDGTNMKRDLPPPPAVNSSAPIEGEEQKAAGYKKDPSERMQSIYKLHWDRRETQIIKKTMA